MHWQSQWHTTRQFNCNKAIDLAIVYIYEHGGKRGNAIQNWAVTHCRRVWIEAWDQDILQGDYASA